MANVLNNLKTMLRRATFITSPMSVVVNPAYIIRNGIYQAILSMAPGIKGDVLDFGCGSKPYESLFVNAGSYVGVDVEVSGHNHQRSQVDVYYDGKTLPFPDNHFDAVVAFEVFEHVFSIDEVLGEIRRVLKPGGQILLTIPFAWDEHELPYDFARYTSFGIRHVLERNHFEVRDVRKTTTYFLAVSQMLIAYLAQHVFPVKNTPARAVAQLLFVFPLTLTALALNLILPKRYEYFCNCAVLGVNAKVD
jgi:SAM-dependent methyltransferase